MRISSAIEFLWISPESGEPLSAPMEVRGSETGLEIWPEAEDHATATTEAMSTRRTGLHLAIARSDLSFVIMLATTERISTNLLGRSQQLNGCINRS
jgi:hypothetical protein